MIKKNNNKSFVSGCNIQEDGQYLIAESGDGRDVSIKIISNKYNEIIDIKMGDYFTKNIKKDVLLVLKDLLKNSISVLIEKLNLKDIDVFDNKNKNKDNSSLHNEIVAKDFFSDIVDNKSLFNSINSITKMLSCLSKNSQSNSQDAVEDEVNLDKDILVDDLDKDIDEK